MSHFYGTLNGSRGQATRCGTKGSGVRTIAASWSGAVAVYLRHDAATGKDHYDIWLTPWHGKGASRLIAEGTL